MKKIPSLLLTAITLAACSPASLLSTTNDATVSSSSSSSVLPMQPYINQRYDYSIQFPMDWFADPREAEKDFTRRGGSTIGGDLYLSNYPNPTEYTRENPAPADLRLLTLMFYKVAPSVTLDDFVKDEAFVVDQELDVKVQGREALKLVTAEENEPTVVNTLVRLDDAIAVFNYNGNPLLSEDAEIYESIIRSFTVGQPSVEARQ
jgi:hypothetical protein